MGEKRLFGTRGIRGPIATKTTPDLMLKIGQALATSVGGGKIVVARDARTSGDMLKHAFVSGALSEGCDVIDIGLVPSPCVAYTTREIKARAGAIITASHNPPTDNGIAFYRSDGMEFLSDETREIEKLVLKGKPKLANWDALGAVRRFNAIPHYIRAIKQAVKVRRGIKVVVDCANGAGATVTPYLLRELGCKVVTLNSHLDGSFPGRLPEPQPWNLTDLMSTVKELGADVGIAHDGDADRIAVIDERGKFIKHDALIALFAKREVEARGGGAVVTSVNTSIAIEEVVSKAGGKTFRTALGKFHEERLKRNAIFAGEPGKLIFLNFGPWADGVLGAAKLLEVISRARKPVSKIFAAEVPDYPMHFEDFPCPDERKAEFMRNIRRYLLENISEVRDVLEIDGIRVNLKNGSWILIRTSGTEPKARLAIEGRTTKEFERLKKLGLRGIHKFLKG